MDDDAGDLEILEELFHAVLLVAISGLVGLFIFEAAGMILDLT